MDINWQYLAIVFIYTACTNEHWKKLYAQPEVPSFLETIPVDTGLSAIVPGPDVSLLPTPDVSLVPTPDVSE